jgi:serine/threonine protein kinase
LPPGTRFGEFEILRVLGVGGFGIVYLANDHSLEREVALKEYMPASLAARGAGPQITVRSSSFAETYAIGLRSFVNEARLLARFDHPSLVKVYRFWEDNATAYMVMPYLQGVTLRDTRRRMAHPPTSPGSAASSRRSSRRSSCCTAKASTTATSRPTTSCCSTRDRRSCSTSARRAG